MSAPTPISAASASSDTSNVARIPDAVERRIGAVNAAADTLRFQLGRVRDAAFAYGLAEARRKSHESDTARRQEQSAVRALDAALVTLVTIALRADEDGAL